MYTVYTKCKYCNYLYVNSVTAESKCSIGIKKIFIIDIMPVEMNFKRDSSVRCFRFCHDKLRFDVFSYFGQKYTNTESVESILGVLS